MGTRTGTTIVVGLGTPLLGDDGLGLATVARLREEWTLPDDVVLADGETRAPELLPLVEEAERLLLVDAVDRGMRPGTEIVLDRAELAAHLSRAASPTRVDVREVLALAALRGTLPPLAVAVGLQPTTTELGWGLSPAVQAALDRFVLLVVDQLRAWGHRCEPQRRRHECAR